MDERTEDRRDWRQGDAVLEKLDGLGRKKAGGDDGDADDGKSSRDGKGRSGRDQGPHVSEAMNPFELKFPRSENIPVPSTMEPESLNFGHPREDEATHSNAKPSPEGKSDVPEVGPYRPPTKDVHEAEGG